MRYLLTGKQMKAVDSYNIEELGIPSLVLMERAACAVALEAEKMTEEGSRVLILCGMGNNGADGLAVARMLKLHKRDVEILLCGSKSHATKEHTVQQNIVEKLKIPAGTVDTDKEYSIESRIIGKYTLIIDALFGVGLTRPLEGIYRELVKAVNLAGEAGAKILAVDIPSGVSASDGQILGCAIRADRTVTFGYKKLGMVFYPGNYYCGEQIVADIGFVMPTFMEKELVRSFETEDLSALPKRPADGNKGTFGKVLVVAGSRGMCGAAYMSGLAAYRTGAGLVQIYTVRENVPMLQTMLPEAIVTAYDREHFDEDQLKKLCSFADVIVAGPGLSTEPYAEKLLFWFLKHAELPMVLDADALNIIAGNDVLLEYLDSRMIVTPHVGEMARLTGKGKEEIKSSPIKTAGEFYDRSGAVCVLKDARTVVVSECGTYLNVSGNSGMATGGSGDVLSGMIGGLLAGGMKPSDAAELGVYLHGMAGDAAAEKYGKHAMLATDILACLSDVQKKWE